MCICHNATVQHHVRAVHIMPSTLSCFDFFMLSLQGSLSFHHPGTQYSMYNNYVYNTVMEDS